MCAFNEKKEWLVPKFDVGVLLKASRDTNLHISVNQLHPKDHDLLTLSLIFAQPVFQNVFLCILCSTQERTNSE